MSCEKQSIDTTYSDLALMIGGQFLILFIIIIITLFGVDPISEPLRNLSGTIVTTLSKTGNTTGHK